VGIFRAHRTRTRRRQHSDPPTQATSTTANRHRGGRGRTPAAPTTDHHFPDGGLPTGRIDQRNPSARLPVHPPVLPECVHVRADSRVQITDRVDVRRRCSRTSATGRCGTDRCLDNLAVTDRASVLMAMGMISVASVLRLEEPLTALRPALPRRRHLGRDRPGGGQPRPARRRNPPARRVRRRPRKAPTCRCCFAGAADGNLSGAPSWRSGPSPERPPMHALNAPSARSGRASRRINLCKPASARRRPSAVPQ
jgi:hypothetical protein